MVKENILKLFSTTALTASGRPKMIADSEVELKYVENVNIETVQKEKVFYNQSIILTNMRMLLVPGQQVTEGGEKTCRVLHLRFVTKFSDNAGIFKHSRRITATIIDGLQFHIRFNGGDKEVTLDMLAKSLLRRAWESVVDRAMPSPPSSSSSSLALKDEKSTFSVLNAGVSGLKRRQAEVCVCVGGGSALHVAAHFLSGDIQFTPIRTYTLCCYV
jgi:hypothetical protein